MARCFFSRSSRPLLHRGHLLGCRGLTSIEIPRPLAHSATLLTSSTIRRVTVAGTTGAIGAVIISVLSRAGYEVQALSRTASSPQNLPANTRKVDYTNESQLKVALKGQDAVVSCLGDTPSAVSAQRTLIDASIKAGVSRFLPSEFGSDTSNAYVKRLPFFKAKARHQDILKYAALQHPHFSYTNLITGLFLDWCLSTVPCIINCGSRTAQVYDCGNIPFSVTRTAAVAEAVLGVLQRPEQTRNKTLRVHETSISQNELIRRAEGLTTHLSSFTRISIDTVAYEACARQAYTDPRANALDWIVPCINLSVWSSNQPGFFNEVDNAILGVKELKGTRRGCVIDAELYNAMHKLSSIGSRETQVGIAIDAGQRMYDEGKQRLVVL